MSEENKKETPAVEEVKAEVKPKKAKAKPEVKEEKKSDAQDNAKEVLNTVAKNAAEMAGEAAVATTKALEVVGEKASQAVVKVLPKKITDNEKMHLSPAVTVSLLALIVYLALTKPDALLIPIMAFAAIVYVKYYKKK